MSRHSPLHIGVTGAYPALRWFGGGEPKNGGALPEYNIQQSTVLEIWSEGVLAAAATARGTRRRAGQTRRTDGNTGGGDRTGAESEEAIDWGDFEEAEMAQERADNKRWWAEDSIDEYAHTTHFIHFLWHNSAYLNSGWMQEFLWTGP